MAEARMSSDQGPGTPGPAVDTHGNPAIDPTANVLALVEAAVRRIDDVLEAKLERIDSISNLRAEYDRRIDELRKELRHAESERIDAIRAVDVAAVQRASDVSADQAEALRTTVAAAATAFDAKLVAVITPIQQDIADLRRAQYEAQGQKTQVVENRANAGAVYAAIGLGITLVLMVLAIAGFAVANSGGS